MTRTRSYLLSLLILPIDAFVDASGSFGLARASSAASSAAVGVADREVLPRRRRRLAGALESYEGIFVVRGGGTVGTAPRPKKSKKAGKKRKASVGASEEDGDATDAAGDVDVGARKAINDAMKESDAAAALGNAIRDRADILRRDALPTPERAFDAALASLGLSMGTSGVASSPDDAVAAARRESDAEDASAGRWDSEGGGVRPSPSALVANYFLQTHGGAHAFQCALSVLASLFGLGCVLIPPSVSNGDAAAIAGGAKLAGTKLILLRRCLQCALAKHAAGLVGAALLGAAKVPEMGLRRTRRYVAALALDPVSQYLFYCALLLVWTSLESSDGGIIGAGSDVAKAAWWLRRGTGGSVIPLLVLGPVLLREVASAVWVASDVAVLLSSGSLPAPLRASRAVLDAFICILVRSPEAWRTAGSAARQRTLARMVSRVSLGMELVVGVVLALDAVRAFLAFSLAAPSAAISRPALLSVVGKMACTHLYINFLLARRKKIVALVGSIRGGAIVNRVLDVLIQPGKAMGLEDCEDDNDRFGFFSRGESEGGGGGFRRNFRTAASAFGIE